MRPSNWTASAIRSEPVLRRRRFRWLPVECFHASRAGRVPQRIPELPQFAGPQVELLDSARVQRRQCPRSFVRGQSPVSPVAAARSERRLDSPIPNLSTNSRRPTQYRQCSGNGILRIWQLCRLTAKLERRFSNGLSYSVSYTSAMLWQPAAHAQRFIGIRQQGPEEPLVELLQRGMGYPPQLRFELPVRPPVWQGQEVLQRQPRGGFAGRRLADERHPDAPQGSPLDAAHRPLYRQL